MRTYIPSPDLTRPMGSEVPFVVITTASNVCSDDAYTVRFPDPKNQFVTALQLTFTDDEADEFIEKFAEARFARLRQQEQTYENLHAKFGGSFDNGPADHTVSDWIIAPDEERCDTLSETGDRCVQRSGHSRLHTYREGL